ncbi:glycoside hydrolase family 1 protein [candidate division WWE3 bacterium]|nr:glycoside hydrolase family 1 protein [candidate division WWE3 bacterium]
MSRSNDFLFGVSSSSYHIEGGNTASDWHEFEKNIFKDHPEHRNEMGIDYWNRWSQDHDHLSELGVDAFRTSIEWSRVQPISSDYFDESAIEQYCQMLSDLKKRNIRVVLTFVHYVVPKWFADMGGFSKKENLIYFDRFVERILRSCGENIDVVTPVNEMMVNAAFGYLIKYFPPGERNFIKFVPVVRNLIRSHYIVAQLIRMYHPHIHISTAEQFRFIKPEPSNLFMKMIAGISNYLVNDVILKSIVSNHFLPPFGFGGTIDRSVKKPVDSIGIQVYGTIPIRLGMRGWKPTIKPSGYTFWSDAIYDAKVTAESLKEAVLRTQQKYKKPVLITEIGMASEDVTEHERKLHELVMAVESLLEQGVKLNGFLYFTLFDCFEWNHGYDKKFGLIEIDRANNFARKPKPAFYAYKNLILRVKNMLMPKGKHQVQPVQSKQ